MTKRKNPKKAGGDRDHAAKIRAALAELQEAMDVAALSGLIVEPSVQHFPGRFREVGNDAESDVIKIRIYRKLA